MSRTSRTRTIGRGYLNLFFIETESGAIGPWFVTPKSEWKNRIKLGQECNIVKFTYDNELGVYRKEYLNLQLTEKDLAK